MKKYTCKNSIYYSVIMILHILYLCGCEIQNDWLNEKSNIARVIPETADDFQALLDNNRVINTRYPPAGLVGADNFYLTDDGYTSVQESERNMYTWNQEIWPGGSSRVWNDPFHIIELANIVLEGGNGLEMGDQKWRNIRGQAFFHRAMAYYYLAQLFCNPYDSSSAISDLGLPLRTDYDVNVLYPRASLKDTYDFIINNAVEASNLLPDVQSFKERPNKAAAYALLAKVYLNMADYDNALIQATNAIDLNPMLLDFNNEEVVSLDNTYRFPLSGVNHPEILFYARGSFTSVSSWTSTPGIVVPELYTSYEDDDLRKTMFYDLVDSQPKFRGSYAGNSQNFSGLAINETYLIRAECYARKGQLSEAMSDLNDLLQHRYFRDEFIPLTADNADEALTVILQERRKELPFTSNLRWEDLRRFNRDDHFEITLSRTLNGEVYTLLPNDIRYVLPIPDNEIEISGLRQNER